MIARAHAIKAGLNIKAHAHMLRHACGFKLAGKREFGRRSAIWKSVI